MLVFLFSSFNTLTGMPGNAIPLNVSDNTNILGSLQLLDKIFVCLFHIRKKIYSYGI